MLLAFSRTPAMPQPPRHARDRDFAAWALGQARAVRDGLYELVDREILANELERLVSRERSEINRRIEALTVQLLMWTLQPAVRTEALRAAILESRTGIEMMLRASPSLQGAVEDALPRSYAGALDAVAEAGIPRTSFPAEPVFTLEQLLDRHFWPGSMFGGKAFMF
jgi:hypothetical protein